MFELSGGSWGGPKGEGEEHSIQMGWVGRYHFLEVKSELKCV